MSQATPSAQDTEYQEATGSWVVEFAWIQNETPLEFKRALPYTFLSSSSSSSSVRKCIDKRTNKRKEKRKKKFYSSSTAWTKDRGKGMKNRGGVCVSRGGGGCCGGCCTVKWNKIKRVAGKVELLHRLNWSTEWRRVVWPLSVWHVSGKKRKEEKKERKKERKRVFNEASQKERVMPQVCSMERDTLTYTGYVVVRGGGGGVGVGGEFFPASGRVLSALETPWIDEPLASVRVVFHSTQNDTVQQRFVCSYDGASSTTENGVLPTRRIRCKESSPSKRTFNRIRDDETII